MPAVELRRILYVEDESDIRAIVRLALENVGGYQVDACASGGEALERAAAFAPDLILLDVMMPGMDGPQTMSALRALPECASVPVVFLTANVWASELARFRALGVVDVVPKPFDPLTLAATIGRIWEGCHV